MQSLHETYQNPKDIFTGFGEKYPYTLIFSKCFLDNKYCLKENTENIFPYQFVYRQMRVTLKHRVPQWDTLYRLEQITVKD